MKNSTFKILSFIINFGLVLTAFYFDFPFWSFLFLIPASVYVQTYAAQQFSFRDSIQLEEIPARGYEKRLSDLNAEEKRLNDLGFSKFDEFYLRTSNDIVVFAYRHYELPITLCQYHFEAFISHDLMTDFDNDFSLTTSDTKYSAVAGLRPVHKMLQSFHEFTVELLFNRHLNSLRFLEQKGFTVKPERIEDFRDEFMKSFREAAARHKRFLAPVKVFYLMYFGDKARFSKTVQEQYLANQLRLPSYLE